MWRSKVGKLIGWADAVVLTHTDALIFGRLITPYRASVESVRETPWKIILENKLINPTKKIYDGQTTFDPTSLTMDKQNVATNAVI